MSYKVETSAGELFEYLTKPSMRKIKSDLCITGRKTEVVNYGCHWAMYKLRGTCYTFTLTEVC